MEAELGDRRRETKSATKATFELTNSGSVLPFTREAVAEGLEPVGVSARCRCRVDHRVVEVDEGEAVLPGSLPVDDTEVPSPVEEHVRHREVVVRGRRRDRFAGQGRASRLQAFGIPTALCEEWCQQAGGSHHFACEALLRELPPGALLIPPL